MRTLRKRMKQDSSSPRRGRPPVRVAMFQELTSSLPSRRSDSWLGQIKSSEVLYDCLLARELKQANLIRVNYTAILKRLQKAHPSLEVKTSSFRRFLLGPDKTLEPYYDYLGYKPGQLVKEYLKLQPTQDECAEAL